MEKRPLTTGHPDPMRAHGAWIYLFAAVASGALVGARRGVEPAMLVGTAFTGAYLVAAALSMGVRRRIRQILLGTGSAALATVGALWLGVELDFLVVAACALVPAMGAILLAKTQGFLSPGAVVSGVAALAMAAPATAVAGGASGLRSTLLFALLWPFFSWRSLRIAAPLHAGAGWVPEELRARGLREAALAALWSIGVVIALRTF